MSVQGVVPPRGLRQHRVGAWVRQTFGDAAMALPERGMRLAEEAIEAAQAAGVAEHTALQIVMRVYGRKPGELSRELGQVGVTLVALAEAADISAEAAERSEWERVQTIKREDFAVRHAAKVEIGIAS